MTWAFPETHRTRLFLIISDQTLRWVDDRCDYKWNKTLKCMDF